MLQEIGTRIRTLRTHKGISLNAFAEKLNVSPGYLSNLETGKTDTIQLSLLDKLQSELNLLPLDTNQTDEWETAIHQTIHQWMELKKRNSEAADYLLSTFEKGLQLFE